MRLLCTQNVHLFNLLWISIWCIHTEIIVNEKNKCNWTVFPVLFMSIQLIQWIPIWIISFVSSSKMLYFCKLLLYLQSIQLNLWNRSQSNGIRTIFFENFDTPLCFCSTDSNHWSLSKACIIVSLKGAIQPIFRNHLDKFNSSEYHPMSF